VVVDVTADVPPNVEAVTADAEVVDEEVAAVAPTAMEGSTVGSEPVLAQPATSSVVANTTTIGLISTPVFVSAIPTGEDKNQ
jgi:hypothetical protein